MSKRKPYKRGLIAWAFAAAKRLRRKGRASEARQLEREAKAVRVNDRMGKPARTLLADFQRRHGLSPSGVWNSRTLAKLRRYLVVDRRKAAQKLLLAACAVSYAKRDQIHYSYPAHSAERLMGISRRIRPPAVPKYADCSSWVIWMWWACGFPSPCGAWTWGNSDSILAYTRSHGRIVPLGQERAGDIAIYVGGVGHAAQVVSRGTVLSNGREAGPVYESITAHGGQLYICRLRPFLP